VCGVNEVPLLLLDIVGAMVVKNGEVLEEPRGVLIPSGTLVPRGTRRMQEYDFATRQARGGGDGNPC